jgi:hypothetical protein
MSQEDNEIWLRVRAVQILVEAEVKDEISKRYALNHLIEIERYVLDKGEDDLIVLAEQV